MAIDKDVAVCGMEIHQQCIVDATGLVNGCYVCDLQDVARLVDQIEHELAQTRKERDDERSKRECIEDSNRILSREVDCERSARKLSEEQVSEMRKVLDRIIAQGCYGAIELEEMWCRDHLDRSEAWCPACIATNGVDNAGCEK